MGKHPKLISFFWLIIYTILTFFFLSLLIKTGGGFDKEIKDLAKLIDRGSPQKILLVISVLTTLLSTVVAYFIARFLLFFFTTDIKCNMSDILIPKSLVIIVNILFITLLNLYDPRIFMLTAFIGAIGILLLFQLKKKNWLGSIIFSIPFIADALLSLAKTTASLF
jgi:hypothetical protein